MTGKERLISNLHKVIRDDPYILDICKSSGLEIDTLETVINEVYNQFWFDEATITLPLYEKELAIPIDHNKDISQRRSVIKSKYRGFGKVDRDLIRTVAESYNNGSVLVFYGASAYSYDTYQPDTFTPPYPIIIKFVDTKGIPDNIDDLKKVIEDIKPAHLPVIFEFRYMTWNELDETNTTWDQLDAMNLSWNEFEKGDWI
ncbi:putative phage tail protein [Schinkia azotoformans]|uniref:putative phage tail protein n=1 Tax=Schinkia azotoformans TaxID=1454 RepID=UPI002DBF6AF3|nr:putative phage tail protein [Schinkia azotoformans]MEC1757368.1 DUF2313 domain-containing protein [Schinkia azotoformans]